MTDQFGPKLINICVAKLSNSPAITGVSRLDLDEFESQLNSPRLVQRFLKLINAQIKPDPWVSPRSQALQVHHLSCPPETPVPEFGRLLLLQGGE